MSDKKLWRICVDLDSAKEEAEHLESFIIEAGDEDEAQDKADAIVKKQIMRIRGPERKIKHSC